MTPVFGIIFAIACGLLAPSRGAAIKAAVVLMATATAIQTWDLGAGLGSNPASTIREGSYWVVQLIIVAVITALTAGVFEMRARRARSEGRPLRRDGFVGRHGGLSLALGEAALLVVGLVIVSVMYGVHKTHGHGAGSIPAGGVIGLVVGSVAAVALGAYAYLGARRGHVGLLKRTA